MSNTWSPYFPILEGFYWVKCVGILSGKEYIQVAKIYKMNAKSLCMFLEGDNYREGDMANVRAFMGPIPAPSL